MVLDGPAMHQSQLSCRVEELAQRVPRTSTELTGSDVELVTSKV